MNSSRNAAGEDGLSELFGTDIGGANDGEFSSLAHAPIADLTVISTPGISTPGISTPGISTPGAPLTRREARLAEAAAASRPARLKATAAAVAPTPQPQAPRPEVFSYEGIVFPSHPTPRTRATAKADRRAAKRAASAPSELSRGSARKDTSGRTRTQPLRTQSLRTQPLRSQPIGMRKRASSALTILAVTGFFAAVCIPAYAISPIDTDLAAAPETVAASDRSASLFVAQDAAELNVARDTFSATTASDLADARSSALKIANFEAYDKSGARELGDDYPWFSELSNNQGGGLSPLNYYYRECVDFVAWRLNRDAGSTSAPFKWDWNNMTPGGGSAYAWERQWIRNGWATGKTPKAGSVAWFGYHVSYVKSVNADGTVTLEEYNHQSDHLYGQRTIPATDVTTYLYAPPR
ncbi:MAG: CHAP domain-containing protein [Microbacteriaceae bacterium]